MMRLRPLPFAVTIKMLLFANVNAFVAAIFLLVGLLFGAMMYGPGAADILGNWKQSGEAIITSIDATNMTTSDGLVFAYRFSGHTTDGFAVLGTSYQLNKKFEVGQTVSLEKCLFFGEKWRLTGAAFSTVGVVQWFVWIFFVAGILFIIAAFLLWWFGVFLLGLKRLWLIRNGEIEKAVFLNSQELNIKVNMKTLVKMTFQFEAANGQTYPAVVYTTRPDDVLSETSEKLTVFYAPESPEKNYILRAMKGLDFDEHTEILTYSPWKLLPDLIATLIMASTIGFVFTCFTKAMQNGLIFGCL